MYISSKKLLEDLSSIITDYETVRDINLNYVERSKTTGEDKAYHVGYSDGLNTAIRRLEIFKGEILGNYKKEDKVLSLEDKRKEKQREKLMDALRMKGFLE